MSNPIFTIWKKELIDTVRDKRTFASTILLPMLLMPGLFVGISKFSAWQIKQLSDKEVTVAANSDSSSLTDWLTTKDSKIKLLTTDQDPTEAVRQKKAELALSLPADWSSQLAANTPVNLNLMTNSTNASSSSALARITALIAQYNQELTAGRLTAAGLSPAIQIGLVPTPQDVATAQEQAGFGLGYILPLFIIMWAVTGGQTTAIDASAGERERKTIEALLLTPVSRFTIVAGKFLAVATGALLSVIISIASMTWASKYMGEMITAEATSTVAGASTGSLTSGFNLDFNLTPGTIGVLLFISIILVALFSAVNLAIAIFAKNYKEAQSYIGPSYLVIILPVVLVNTLPNVSDQLWIYAVPIVNAVVLFKEVLIGQYVWSHLLLTTAVLLLTSWAAMWGAARIYRREDVIFTD